jgi:transposase
MSGAIHRRRFDAQFKLDAVRLIQQGERSVREIARELGVRNELLYRWQRELATDAKNAFPGQGKRKPEQEQLHQLQQELKRVTEERDILKKALAFFAKHGE